MIVRIKYIDPVSKEEVIEEVDTSTVDLPKYCKNIHHTVLCDPSDCDGETCKIWVESHGEFVLAGIED